MIAAYSGCWFSQTAWLVSVLRASGVSVAPDGSLYVMDWHKPLIGHLQHHLRDSNREQDHGRIYRLTFEGMPLLKPAGLAG